MLPPLQECLEYLEYSRKFELCVCIVACLIFYLTCVCACYCVYDTRHSNTHTLTLFPPVCDICDPKYSTYKGDVSSIFVVA